MGVKICFNSLGFTIFLLFLAVFSESDATCISSSQCRHGGQCITANGRRFCNCSEEYVGEYCQFKNPCSASVSQCQNGGTCNVQISETKGVKFTCACPVGFTASLCEVPLPNVCDHEPCKNSATCHLVDTVHSYRCICPAGFQGPTCEQVDHCASRPCHNGALCISTERGFVCNCSSGFTGNTCTEDIDECSRSKPCVRGTCHNLPGSYRCDCPEEYTGKNCESVYRPCEPSPCENGGTCTKYSTYQYFCQCKSGYTGRHCEVNIDDCENNLCQNGGVCVDKLGGYECRCPSNYKGEFCTQDVDECTEHSGLCQHGSTCVNTVGSYHCICVNGWEGKNCEINKNDCTGQVCYNGGTCHDLVGSFKCECPVGKTGLLCHLDDACMSNPCQAPGSECATNPVDGGFLCTCPKGFQGNDCSIDIDECEEGNPCAHGTCVNTPGSYHCDCIKGWKGAWCDENINECASNPCQNDATCLDHIGKFVCICMPGFKGDYCEDHVANECVSNPCQHGGHCLELKNGYKCNCAAGYTGTNCQTNINECEPNVCQNGGTCIDAVYGFQCLCPFGYSGQRCEIQRDFCRNISCQNGGTCRMTANGQFSCTCRQGFTGTYCHEDINECSQAVCENGGTCVNTMGSFKCLCQIGFTGDRCETNVDDCASGPCRNRGVCKDLVNGYKCECRHGFEGADCGRDINECASNPCQNGAECLDEVAYFHCICKPGFSGTLCERNDNDCQPGLCLNGGSCFDGINKYRCHCAKGFAGKNCEFVIRPVPNTEELEECKKHGCQSKANNGVCDAECNYAACDFDGGDCSLGDPDPYKNCTNKALCSKVFKNGHCDESCNTQDCLFDGYDCNRPVGPCNPLYYAYCERHFGNGHCDPGCNNAGCGFDGGDCKEEVDRSLPGDLVMILLVEPEVLLNQTKRFLMTLSKLVQANVLIKRDPETGKPMIFSWNSNGQTQLVHVPESSALMELTSATPADFSASKRRKRFAATTDPKYTGTLIVMTVDISKCIEEGRDDCFTDVISLAAYLAALSAKDVLRQKLGFSAYSAYGKLVPPPPEKKRDNVVVIVISLLACVALLFLVILVLARKRKIAAPIWVPQGFEGKVPSTLSLDKPPSTKGSVCGSYSTHHGMTVPNTYESDYNLNLPKRTPSFHRKDPQLFGQYLDSDWSDSEYAAANYAGGPYGGGPPVPKKQRNFINSEYSVPDKRAWCQHHMEVVQGTIGCVGGGISKVEINKPGPDSMTPLHVAAMFGRNSESEQAAILENVLNQGADLNAKTDHNQDCALILATKYGRVEPVKVMLAHGADPNETDSKGMAALHHAILTNVAENIRSLLACPKTKVDLTDCDETTPLILAAKMSHADRTAIELLLEYGASVSCGDKDGKTALHWAAVHNNVPALELLLSKGANKDAQDLKDQTPLFLAAREGNVRAIDCLLQHGASKDVTDQMDRQPRDIADDNNHKIVVDLLDKAPTHPQGALFNPGSTATLPHGHGRSGNGAGGKPKPPRRSKSMRESRGETTNGSGQGRRKGNGGGSKSQERRPSISMANGAAPIALDGTGGMVHSASGPQMVYSPHSEQSPQSIVNFESPLSAGSSSTNFGMTPSPGSTLRNNGQILSVPPSSNGKTSSCALMSPYNGSVSSGLSPHGTYKSPPPYGSSCGTPTGGMGAYYHRSPQNYGQSPPQFMPSNPDMSATMDYVAYDQNGSGGYTTYVEQDASPNYQFEGATSCQQQIFCQNSNQPQTVLPAQQQNSDFYSNGTMPMHQHMNGGIQYIPDESGAYHLYHHNAINGLAC